MLEKWAARCNSVATSLEGDRLWQFDTTFDTVVGIQSRPMSQRRKRIARFLLFWLVAWSCYGCGDSGVVIISFRSGIVVGDVDCNAGGGSFDLLDQQGLTVLVIITSDTSIVFAGGNFGTCDDIRRNRAVEVSGPEDNGTIRAQTIQLGV